jgi:hypothetical protein
MREMVVSLSSLLSFLLVSEATILPHYKIPVTGSALKLTPMLTLWLKHDGFQEEERAMSPDVGLLRSVFSKHYMNSNKVINANGLSSACVLKGGVVWFLAFSFGFRSQFCEDCCQGCY